MLADDDFRTKYAHARDMGLDAMADDLLDIADDGTNDWGCDSKGNPKPDIDHIRRSALRVDARKWYLAKLAPKKYGDKINHEVGGRDGGPVTFQWAAPEETHSDA